MNANNINFKKSYSTIEQFHRDQTGKQTFECRKYCSGTFFDVQQAFDRIWHKLLLTKVKENHPHSHAQPVLLIRLLFPIKTGRSKITRQQASLLFELKAGVPQGPVFGPLLCNIFLHQINPNWMA